MQVSRGIQPARTGEIQKGWANKSQQHWFLALTHPTHTNQRNKSIIQTKNRFWLRTSQQEIYLFTPKALLLLVALSIYGWSFCATIPCLHAWTEQLPPTTHTGCSMPGSCPKAMTLTPQPQRTQGGPWVKVIELWGHCQRGSSISGAHHVHASVWRFDFCEHAWRFMKSWDANRHGLLWRRGRHFPTLRGPKSTFQHGCCSVPEMASCLWVQHIGTWICILNKQWKTIASPWMTRKPQSYNRTPGSMVAPLVQPPHHIPLVMSAFPPSAHPAAKLGATSPWPPRWSYGWCSGTWPALQNSGVMAS